MDESSDDHSIVAENGHVDGVEQSICMTSHEIRRHAGGAKELATRAKRSVASKISQNCKLNHCYTNSNAMSPVLDASFVVPISQYCSVNRHIQHVENTFGESNSGARRDLNQEVSATHESWVY